MGFRNTTRGVRPGSVEALQLAVQHAQETADAAAATAGDAVDAAGDAQTAAGAAATDALQAQTAAELAATAAANADTNASAAGTVAARKIRTFTGTTTPAAEAAGDLWLRGPLTGGYYELNRASAAGTGSWATFGLVAAAVAAGAIDGLTVTGALLRTAAAGQRLEMGTAGFKDRIQGYNGQDETTHSPGRLAYTLEGSKPTATLGSGYKTSAPAGKESYIQLSGQADNLLDPPEIHYFAGLGTDGHHVFKGGVMFDESPFYFKGFDWDETTYHFSAAGEATVPHLLSGAPQLVIVQVNALFTARAFNYTATNFQIQLRQTSDGSIPAAADRQVGWYALRIGI